MLPPDHFRGRLVEKAVERRHAGLGREPGDVGGGLDPKDSKPERHVLLEPRTVVAADIDDEVGGAEAVGLDQPGGGVCEMGDKSARRARHIGVIGKHRLLGDRMVDLYQRAVVAEPDTQRVVGLAFRRPLGRDEPVAVRLLPEVEKQFDVAPATAATVDHPLTPFRYRCRNHSRARRGCRRRVQTAAASRLPTKTGRRRSI